MTSPRRSATELVPPPRFGHVALDQVCLVKRGSVGHLPVMPQEVANASLVVVDDVARQVPGEGQQIVVRNDVVHQSVSERVGGGEEVARQRELDGAPQADRLGHENSDPTTGHDPDPGVRVGEARPFRGHEKCALKRDLEPSGHGDAVDGADNRFVDHREEPEEAVRVTLGAFSGITGTGGGRLLARNLLEVDARGEAGSAPVRTTASTSGSPPAR